MVAATAEAFSPSPATPSFPLGGGVHFLELVALKRMTPQALRSWLLERLIAPGLMTVPRNVYEIDARGRVLAFGFHQGGAERVLELDAIVETARIRVLSGLAGLREIPVRDDFLTAMRESGRVVKHERDGEAEWVARPSSTDPLGQIVLALFAASALNQRAVYDRALCVCRNCGAVTFDPAARPTRCRLGCRARPSSRPPRRASTRVDPRRET